MQRLIFIFIILTLNLTMAQAQKQNFTPEMLNSLARVSDMQLSPDGKWVIYKVSTPSIKENKFNSEIKAVSIDGKETKVLSGDDAKDRNMRWTPDGKRIAFISGRDETAQIYIMDFPDGKPKKITDMENGVGNLAWTPDGKSVSFTSDVQIYETILEQYPGLPEADVRMYEDLPVRNWDEWNDEKFSHLFIQKIDGGKPLDVMSGEACDTPLKPFGGGSQIAWPPDSKEIAYTAKKVPDYELSTNSDIYIYDIKSGKTRNITAGIEGFDKSPLYSPDGKWIAFTSMERAGFEADKVRLMLYDRESGNISELSNKLDQWISGFIWAPDSKSLYFSSGARGTYQIYNMQIADGSYHQVTTGTYNYDSGLAITPDGKTLVFGRRHMTRPPELYAMNFQSKKITQLTHENDEAYKKIKLVDIKERWVESTDGKKVHCWVLYPPDFDPSKKYPMITYCQGGPQSMISHYFSFRWNLFLMASQGYVVLAPNRRGMPGFGQDWNDAISKDWGGQPMRDILAATDEMMSQPYIDKDRVAAVGASAGGYAAFWLAGNHQGRFAAFISHCGVFNFESMYGSTEELWFPNWEYGGPYWEKQNQAIYMKDSPHRYAQNWDTPILITTGENDFRVPYTQSLEAFTVAQVKGVPSKLIVFPNENHWVLKPQNAVLWQREFYKFLYKYCK